MKLGLKNIFFETNCKVFEFIFEDETGGHINRFIFKLQLIEEMNKNY